MRQPSSGSSELHDPVIHDNTLRLAFSDFWEGFDPRDNFLWQVLTSRWRVELDDDADLLVYGPFGRRHVHRRTTKVLCWGEPHAFPSRREYDYSLSWRLRDNDRHARVPLGVWNLLQYSGDAEALASRSFDEWAERPYFCNFIYSNAAPSERREFFAALSRRRFVHSPGVVETNTAPLPGGRWALDWWRQKVAYQRQFRFTIAFENSALPGYTTEKVVDALLAGTIPVYWGNPEVALDVDSASFIDAGAFGSWDKLAEHVAHLDDNRELARPLFEHPRPLLVDLDKTRDAIVSLFECAEVESRLARRARRTVRPWLLDAEWLAKRAVRKLARTARPAIRQAPDERRR